MGVKGKIADLMKEIYISKIFITVLNFVYLPSEKIKSHLIFAIIPSILSVFYNYVNTMVLLCIAFYYENIIAGNWYYLWNMKID